MKKALTVSVVAIAVILVLIVLWRRPPPMPRASFTDVGTKLAITRQMVAGMISDGYYTPDERGRV
jgi:hypothetical protein